MLSIKITPIDGEPWTVRTNLFVMVATERKFKIRSSDFANGIGLEHLAFMAYEASKQVGVPVPPVFDDFVKRIAEVEIMDGDDVDPTNGGQ